MAGDGEKQREWWFTGGWQPERKESRVAAPILKKKKNEKEEWRSKAIGNYLVRWRRVSPEGKKKGEGEGQWRRDEGGEREGEEATGKRRFGVVFYGVAVWPTREEK
ncbi:hypothetical protein HAX54_051788, partial [Datura stramonium]|nr:hypothetical protein [Datura stramonium]